MYRAGHPLTLSEVNYMGKPIILVGSVTYAMKARELLWKRGVHAAIERVPPTEATGCGYGVVIPEGPDKADEAEQFLRSSGIKVLGRTQSGGTG